MFLMSWSWMSWKWGSSCHAGEQLQPQKYLHFDFCPEESFDFGHDFGVHDFDVVYYALFVCRTSCASRKQS
jgi:hypothetical protein